MSPPLRALALRQGGVFTRRQALASGCTERELRTRTGARGDWVVVRRGVYAERAHWDSKGERGRFVLGTRAVLLTTSAPARASHSSAAALLGFPLRPHWLAVQHVTRPGVTGGRLEGGVKHHRAAYSEGDQVTLGGVPALGLARTALDIAREHGFEDGVVAADAALRLGATKEQLDAGLVLMTSWPGVTAARHAVAVADGGAESIGETLLRLLVLELGIGTPETQFVLSDGHRRAVADLRVGRHLFEFDGKVKYLGRDLGGVADVPAHEVVFREKQREDFCRNHDGGYGMSRVVWSDLLGRARQETRRRLLREYLESRRLFGRLEQPDTRRRGPDRPG